MENKKSEIIIYRTPQGKVSVDVVYDAETFWLTQKAIAELFGVGVPAVSKHIKNIFEEGELQEHSTISKMETVVNRGFRGEVKEEIVYYNLDMIIAVGYRVNSYNATQFRIWATQTLKEYIIKGFAMDDERLKNGKKFGKDYFDELLERIREIRSSERRFYQKITDIYTLSVDYDRNAQITKDFFATVQNKLHWAITGETAAEVIYKNADASKIFMGLTTWKNAPDGQILKSDVTIAKNYLNEQHIKELNRIVSAFLDLAENRAERNILMKMQDWIIFLNQFLELSNYPILEHKGKISALEAKINAETEFEKYRIIQDKNYISDFDREIKRLEGKY